VLVCCASSTCQISNPPLGSDASNPVCCRFSSRKYSLPPVPFFHRRWPVLDVFTSVIVMAAFVLTVFTVAHPWFALHQAEGCTGTSPPPPQLPAAIKHQLPIPSDEE